jgi:hypothetical protein
MRELDRAWRGARGWQAGLFRLRKLVGRRACSRPKVPDARSGDHGYSLDTGWRSCAAFGCSALNALRLRKSKSALPTYRRWHFPAALLLPEHCEVGHRPPDRDMPFWVGCERSSNRWRRMRFNHLRRRGCLRSSAVRRSRGRSERKRSSRGISRPGIARLLVFSVRSPWRSPAANRPARPTRWDWTAIGA